MDMHFAVWPIPMSLISIEFSFTNDLMSPGFTFQYFISFKWKTILLSQDKIMLV